MGGDIEAYVDKKLHSRFGGLRVVQQINRIARIVSTHGAPLQFSGKAATGEGIAEDDLVVFQKIGEAIEIVQLAEAVLGLDSIAAESIHGAVKGGLKLRVGRANEVFVA